MLNPNTTRSIGDASDGPTQWDDVTEEMDKFDIEVAKQAVAARKQMESLKSQRNTIQKEIDDMKKPSGIYYADGLDA